MLKVRRTTKLGCCATQPILDASSLNSMYASSSTTRTGSANTSSNCSVLKMLPSGLLGEVRKIILGLCSATAALMPARCTQQPVS